LIERNTKGKLIIQHGKPLICYEHGIWYQLCKNGQWAVWDNGEWDWQDTDWRPFSWVLREFLSTLIARFKSLIMESGAVR